MGESSKIVIYTDGSSLGNPGPGGYAGIIIHSGGKEQIVSGGFRLTTNNRMELKAVIESLKALGKRARQAELFTDSRLIVDAVNQYWLQNWIRKNWKKSTNEPVLNVDLWKELVPLIALHKVKFTWVKGHADNEYNEKCDSICREIAGGKNLPPDIGYEGIEPDGGQSALDFGPPKKKELPGNDLKIDIMSYTDIDSKKCYKISIESYDTNQILRLSEDGFIKLKETLSNYKAGK